MIDWNETMGTGEGVFWFIWIWIIGVLILGAFITAGIQSRNAIIENNGCESIIEEKVPNNNNFNGE